MFTYAGVRKRNRMKKNMMAMMLMKIKKKEEFMKIKRFVKRRMKHIFMKLLYVEFSSCSSSPKPYLLSKIANNMTPIDTIKCICCAINCMENSSHIHMRLDGIKKKKRCEKKSSTLT